MFIRSQDKRTLLSAESHIISASYAEKGTVIAYSVGVSENDYYIPLGEYGTDERAIEVVDEIMREYCAPNLIVPHVFQMPEK